MVDFKRKMRKASIFKVAASFLALGVIASFFFSPLSLTPAFAAGESGEVKVVASSPNTQTSGNAFNYNISWSCSGTTGTTCTNLAIDIPVTLTAPAGSTLTTEMLKNSYSVSANNGAAPGDLNWDSEASIFTFKASAPVAAGVTESFTLNVLTTTPLTPNGSQISLTPTITANEFSPVTGNTINSSVTSSPSGAVDITAKTPQLYTTDRVLAKLPVTIDAPAWFLYNDESLVTSGNYTSNGTEVLESWSATVVIPVDAEYISSKNGVYDPVNRTVTWTFDRSNIAYTEFIQSPFTDEIQVSLPRAIEVNGPGYRAFSFPLNLQGISVTDQTLTRSDSVEVYNYAIGSIDGEILKCGVGSMAGPPNGGACESADVNTQSLPSGFTTTDSFSFLKSIQYKTSYSGELSEGTKIEIIENVPCIDNEVAPNSYRSQADCLNPAYEINRIDHIGNLTIDSAEVVYTDGSTEIKGSSFNLTFQEDKVVSSVKTNVTLNRDYLANEDLLNFTGVAASELEAPTAIENYVSMNIVTPDGLELNGESSIGVITLADAEALGYSRIQVSSAEDGGSGIEFSLSLESNSNGKGAPQYAVVLDSGWEFRDNAFSLMKDKGFSLDKEILANGQTIYRLIGPVGSQESIQLAPGSDGVPYRTTAPSYGAWIFKSYAANSLTDMQYCSASNPVDPNGGLDVFNTGLDYCYSESSYAYSSPDTSPGQQTIKTVRGSDGVWRGANEVSPIAPGELGTFNINWQNIGAGALTNAVIYDIFPHVGDTGTIGSQAGNSRGSEYRPELVTAPTVIGSVNATVSYSQSDNPCRVEIGPNIPGCVNDWTTSYENLSEVRAIKVVSTDQLAQLASFNVRFDMKVPEDTPYGQTAWNSVGSIASVNTPQGPQPLVANEAPRVGMESTDLTVYIPGISLEKGILDVNGNIINSAEVEKNAENEVTFRITNTGNEDILDPTLEDSTTVGDKAIENITCSFATQTIDNVERAILPVGSTVDCLGVLTLTNDTEVHTNLATVSGVGSNSGVAVNAEATFNANTPIAMPLLPEAGGVGKDGIIITSILLLTLACGMFIYNRIILKKRES